MLKPAFIFEVANAVWLVQVHADLNGVDEDTSKVLMDMYLESPLSGPDPFENWLYARAWMRKGGHVSRANSCERFNMELNIRFSSTRLLENNGGFEGFPRHSPKGVSTNAWHFVRSQREGLTSTYESIQETTLLFRKIAKDVQLKLAQMMRRLQLNIRTPILLEAPTPTTSSKLWELFWYIDHTCAIHEYMESSRRCLAPLFDKPICDLTRRDVYRWFRRASGRVCAMEGIRWHLRKFGLLEEVRTVPDGYLIEPDSFSAPPLPALPYTMAELQAMTRVERLHIARDVFLNTDVPYNVRSWEEASDWEQSQTILNAMKFQSDSGIIKRADAFNLPVVPFDLD